MTASSVFDVTATRADDWWEVDVADLRGGWTQARRRRPRQHAPAFG
ncbi:MAG TPA: hypothetical protein PKE32_05765 [Miltoncostaeaceae bacterium]|nr:hypothetical protein [Miltoncostaeaceae bacterium]